jgi:hypothetical protein
MKNKIRDNWPEDDELEQLGYYNKNLTPDEEKYVTTKKSPLHVIIRKMRVNKMKFKDIANELNMTVAKARGMDRYVDYVVYNYRAEVIMYGKPKKIYKYVTVICPCCKLKHTEREEIKF